MDAEQIPTPIIFLAGPPGSGKTTLGARACQKLGIKFLDLRTETKVPAEKLRSTLTEAVETRSADVIELPWSLQQDKKALTMARRSGKVLLLWAHPDEMQARSGHSAPLFTSVPGLKSAFGRNGTGCREFRMLDRACDANLLLVHVSLDDAVQALEEAIARIRALASASPTVREGLGGWVRYWAEGMDADREAVEIIVDAMARYFIHLRSQGVSPRTLSGIISDINAAGLMVFGYDAPKGTDVLQDFLWSPNVFTFARKFSDSPAAVDRYARSVNGFRQFLKDESQSRTSKRRKGASNP